MWRFTGQIQSFLKIKIKKIVAVVLAPNQQTCCSFRVWRKERETAAEWLNTGLTSDPWNCTLSFSVLYISLLLFPGPWQDWDKLLIVNQWWPWWILFIYFFLIHFKSASCFPPFESLLIWRRKRWEETDASVLSGLRAQASKNKRCSHTQTAEQVERESMWLQSRE